MSSVRSRCAADIAIGINAVGRAGGAMGVCTGAGDGWVREVGVAGTRAADAAAVPGAPFPAVPLFSMAWVSR
jgi:hypothetical protein